MCITSQGKSIKLKVKDVRLFGAAAQGVKILSIDKPDFVIGIDKIVKEDEAAQLDQNADNTEKANESSNDENEQNLPFEDA